MYHQLCRDMHASLLVGKCPWCGASISHGFSLEADFFGSRPGWYPGGKFSGSTLVDLVEKRGVLEARNAARLIYDIAGCLSQWHSEHGLHGVVSPKNIGLVKDGKLRLLAPDQNIDVRFVGLEDAIDDVDYLAPELALGAQPFDMRADLYGLGCTFYYVLCGHAPFPHGTIAQRLMSHQTGWPKPISQIRTDVPAGLSDICYRLLAKQPEDRYLSAEFVQKVLLPWTKGAS